MCTRLPGTRRETDADAAEAVDAILFVGLLPGWYPPNYDCGACGYATCAEFLHHTTTLRRQCPHEALPFCFAVATGASPLPLTQRTAPSCQQLTPRS